MNVVAAAASSTYGSWTGERRRELLHACADRLEAAREELVELAAEETRLGAERLQGELTRTTNQLRLLGDVGARERRIVSQDAAPGGGDIVTVEVPIGPVAVFAASNFPFAFGVPGGDTASALAAGCPVVVRAHPAQPRLSRRLGELMTEAVASAGAPEGTFGLVEGPGNEVSIDLVTDPVIRAVGFTGSAGGGRALMDAAAARPDPIPVYAEMGSVNPVFVMPSAEGPWADTLAGSILGSGGQLCTEPGLIFFPDDEKGRALAADLAAKVAEGPVFELLTEGMAEHHRAWRETAAGLKNVSVAGSGDTASGREARPFTVTVRAADLTPELTEEHFGPSSVLVLADPEGYATLAANLPGQLTATVIAADDDERAAALLPALAARVGRVVWNGVPTGVAVCEAMQHGGPWPATNVSWSTSVGTESIRRFRRPVAYQGVPEAFLA
jgi:NADP-dependent aldehyde dehydrogenase